MANEKLDILVNPKDENLDKTVKKLQGMKNEIEAAKVSIRSLSAEFARIPSQLGLSVQQIRRFKKELNDFARGSIDTQAINAQFTRQINHIKAQYRDLSSVAVNATASAAREQLRALDNRRFLETVGSMGTGGLTNPEEAKRRLDRAHEARKKALQDENKLARTNESINKRILDLQVQSTHSKRQENDLDRSKINIERTTQLLKLNELQLTRQIVLQDQRGIDILQQRRVLLRQALQDQRNILQATVRTNAEAGKVNKSLQQRAAESREFAIERTLGDGGASLFKIQASLLVNYMLMNQMFSLFHFGTQFVIDLDRAFQNLQAIITATNGQMVTLKQTIIDVAQGTRFTAVEVAEAAVTLGQAGLSAQQVEESLAGVVLLATATGSQLGLSTEVAAGAMNVFNMRAEQMGHIANVAVSAINETQLSMDKLALGLQYAGNISHEAGLSFEEMTAALGAMANAGIRSGSTLGTGLRQVITEFLAPSNKMITYLRRVGLTVEDVDIKSKGLVGVMRTLSEAGFSVTSAFETLDLRAAAAFAAIQAQPEILENLQQSFIYSSAAAQANEIQMRSLGNTFDNFKSTLGTFINTAATPLVQVLQLVTSTANSVLAVLQKTGPVLEFTGTVMFSLLATMAGSRLTSFISGMVASNAQVKALGANATVSAKGVTLLKAAMEGLTKSTVLWTLGISAAIFALTKIVDMIPTAAKKMDEALTNVANSRGEVAKTQEVVDSIDVSLNRLVGRFNELKNNPTAVRTEFMTLQESLGSFGFSITDTVNPAIEDLIDALRRLKQEQQDLTFASLEKTLHDQAVLFRTRAEIATKDLKGSQRSVNSGMFNVRHLMGRAGEGKGQVQETGTILNQLIDESRRAISSMATQQLENMSSDQLNVEIGKANSRIQNLALQDASLSKILSDLDLKSKQGDTVAKRYIMVYNQFRQAVQESIEAERGQISEMLTASGMMLQRVGAAAESNPVVREVMTELDNFRIQMQTLREQQSGTDVSDADKRKIQENMMNVSTEFQAKIMQMLDGLTEESLAEIAKQVGVSPEELKNHISSLVKINLNNAQAIEQQKIEASTNLLIKSQENTVTQAQNFTRKQQALFDRLGESYETQMKKLDAIINEASDLERGGLAGVYSDAELNMIRDQKKGLEISSLQERISGYGPLLSAIDNEYGARATQLGDERRQAKSSNDTIESLKAITASEMELFQIKERRKDLETKMIEDTDRLNAMLGIQTIQNKSLEEQILYSMQAYQQQEAITNRLGYSIQKNLTDGFNSAKNSFSTFLTDFVTGTQSMSEAFSNMVTSILQSMLKMVNDRIASQMLGFILDFGIGMLGGLTGGSGYNPANGPPPPKPTQGASTSNWMDVPKNFFGYNGGGIIKANSGARIGRDNQLVLAQDGEFVLRNSAVEAIGVDNLQQINAMGSRAFSSHPIPQMAVPTKSDPNMVNVYVVTPEQQPPMGPNDVIAVISQDMITGGNTKKLIKQIMTGGA